MLVMTVTRDIRQPSVNHGTSQDPLLSDYYSMVSKRGVKGKHCYYCNVGFGHDTHFELVHHNDDHSDLSESNLKVGCELCHSVKHIDLVSRKMSDPGDIIFLPEMSQVELNQLFWAVAHYDIHKSNGNYTPDNIGEISSSYSGQFIYMKLVARKKFVPDKLQNVALIAQFLKKIPDAKYDNRETLLYGLRYLPSLQYYSDKISAGKLVFNFSNINKSAWPAMLDGD